MSAPTGTAGYNQLRQQGRRLETDTQNAFHTYSQFASAADIPPKASDQERETESKIEEYLEQRDTIIAQLTRLLDSDPALSSSAVKQQNVTLLRDKLSDHRRDMTRLKNNLKHARERSNLLTSVRSDIDAHRASNPEAAEADYMADEGRRIDNSHSTIDGVLSQAYAVQDNFLSQRETLASINRRITEAAGKVPGINTLIGRISAKKRRDGIIMGCFVAFCFIVFWFMS